MRVLYVVPIASEGATSVFTELQIQRLVESGVEAKMIFFGGSMLARKPHLIFSMIIDIWREIRKFRPDVVHAQWGSLLALSTAIATIGGPPLVITFLGNDLNPSPSESRLWNIIRIISSNLAVIRSAAIICVSEELRSRLWFRRNRVRVIVHGINLDRFSPQDRVECRRVLRWPANEPVVLFYAGKQQLVKRLDLAQASVEQASLKIDKLRIEVMWGDVPHDDIPLYLNAADCLLMTSDCEGSPIIVREALACNTPVVSVPVGDVGLWLANLDGTRIVERDPVLLGLAIAEVINAGVRPDGHTRATSYSEDATRRAISDIYMELV